MTPSRIADAAPIRPAARRRCHESRDSVLTRMRSVTAAATGKCKCKDRYFGDMAAEMSESKDISWAEINKAKYYFYGPSFYFAVRAVIHPLTVIKTRLQMQNDAVSTRTRPRRSPPHYTPTYTGTMDAFRKIVRAEGSRALYKGFAFSSLSIISGQLYITSYEVGREIILKSNEQTKLISPKFIDIFRNSVAGGIASLLSQTIVVPIDIISQKQMMLKNSSDSPQSIFSIPKEIFRNHGVLGFYKGYCASLAFYAPSSALWWGFYAYFRDIFYKQAKRFGWHGQQHTVSGRVLDSCAAASAGVISVVITNPIDVARTRLQVDGNVHDGKTLRSTLANLWREEGIRSFLKGVNARIFATVPSSILISTVYELVKKLSVK
jgi:solute carrier family 25, member 44